MLYQQGTQRIEVIVRKEGGSVAETNARETDTDGVGGGSNDNYSFWLGTSNPKRKARVVKTNLTHFLAVSKQLADLVIEHYISGIGYRNGDQAEQDRVQRNWEIGKDGTNVASSVAMGALYGSWGGPLGSIVGASLAAISTGASLAVKYRGRQREYDYKIFKEENAIEYTRARAGINLTDGRLR